MRKKTYSIEEVRKLLQKTLSKSSRSKRKYVSVEATAFVKTQIAADIQHHFHSIVSAANDIINLYPKDCKQGLYPFSRIIPMNNYEWKLRCPIIKITPSNAKYLVSDYSVRYGNEIPYLKRWFPKNSSVKGELGEVINVVVYTKAQLAKEGTKINGDYGIVAINVERKNSSPVTPQTMLNNHLGINFGGNGEKINRKTYKKSVEYWREHAFKER
jgi:hypothetical protein